MWGRALAVTFVVVATSGVAVAQRTRKVKIDTEPEGATIYIGSKDEGPRGESPLELDLPPGEYTVIAEKDRYDSEFASIEVNRPSRRDRRAVSLTIPLRMAMARMRVEGPPPDATVKIDENPALPLGDYLDGFDVTAGPHTVIIEIDGHLLDTKYIDPESGTEAVINVRGRVGGGGGGDDDGDGDGDGDGTTVTTTVDATSERTGPIISIGTLVELAWRKFSYQNNPNSMTTTLDFSQSGQTLFGLTVDVNPFRLTGVRRLHPLAIVLAGGFYGIGQTVDPRGTNLGTVTTFWQRYQAGLRYRISLNKIELDLEAGYASFLYRFEGSENDVDRVPDVSYQTIRFGGRIGARVGTALIYAGGENRAVLSGGAVEERFTMDGVGTADTDAYAARAGIEAAFAGGKLPTRVEATFSRFNWTFRNQQAGGPYEADGGTDDVYGVSFVLGYAY